MGKPRQITTKEYQKRAEQLLKQIKREVQPFADVSPEASAERRKRAENDLLYFCETYLPHYFEDPFESGHKEIAEATSVWNKIVQILGFRGLGKTTLVGTGYNLQAILFKKTRFLPVICDTEDQAIMLMLPLKMELEENERIKQDFGAQRGVEWSEEEFVTTGNVKVEAYSWRSFKRGRKHMQYRARIAYLDDIENSESVQKQANVDKRYDHITNEIYNALDLKKDFQLIIATNKLARYDLAKKLSENKAVHTVAIPAEKENNRATHPKSFPKKVLNRIRATVGDVTYNSQYLLKIISSDQDDFQEKWIRWVQPRFDYKVKAMACDPSVGSTEGHDPKAIITAGMHSDGAQMDAVHAWIRRTTINSMCRQLFELNYKLNPHVVIVESNAFQVLLKDKLIAMAPEMPRGRDLIFKIKQVDNSVNKNTRILRLTSPIENGTLRFVDAGDMDRMISQLLDFKSHKTDNEDDGPDALEMCHRRLMRYAGSGESVGAEII